MADAEKALPPPPGPAAPAPEPAAPVVAPAPEPAVVAPPPVAEQEINFRFCSNFPYRFWQCGLGSTFLSFRLPPCSLPTCFHV